MHMPSLSENAYLNVLSHFHLNATKEKNSKQSKVNLTKQSSHFLSRPQALPKQVVPHEVSEIKEVQQDVTQT